MDQKSPDTEQEAQDHAEPMEFHRRRSSADGVAAMRSPHSSGRMSSFERQRRSFTSTRSSFQGSRGAKDQEEDELR